MDGELQSLREELANLGGDFNEKIEQLARRIDLLESKNISPPLFESRDLTQVSQFAHPSHSSNSSPEVSAATPSVSTPETATSSVTVPATITPKTTQPSAKATPTASSPRNKKPIKKEIQKQSLFALITPLLGPLAGLIEQFSSLYTHYQKQGKAPVFFMTLAGIVALVFGFGYLLQYSFSEYLVS